MCLSCKHEEKPDFRSPEPCKCQEGVVAWESRDGISRTSWLALVLRSVFDWGPTTKNKTAADWRWFLTSVTYACKHKCKDMHAHTKKERGGDGKAWRCWLSSKNRAVSQDDSAGKAPVTNLMTRVQPGIPGKDGRSDSTKPSSDHSIHGARMNTPYT